MNRKAIAALLVLMLAGLLITPQTVSAHQTITVGSYQVEIGWANEPPIVGQRNAIVVNVSAGTANGPAADQAAVDISGLKVDVTYGGQTQELILQPLGEDTPGQYVAPILPTVPGRYTVELSGSLGTETGVNAQVQPEEVEPADSLEFPKLTPDPKANAAGASGGLPGWLSIAGLVLGAVGTGLGVFSLTRKTPVQ